MRAQTHTGFTLVNDPVRLQPEQTQHIWIAVEQETDKLPQLVKDAVPFTFPLLVNILAPEAEIMFEWSNVDTHHVLIVDGIRIRLRYVHAVRDAAAPAE